MDPGRRVRVVSVALSAFWAAAIVGILFTRGWFRGAVGDVAAVALLVHLVGVIRPSHLLWRAVACFVFGAAVEGFQSLGIVDDTWPRWLQITVGRTADWADVLAYAVGAVLAVAGEIAAVRGLRTTRPG